MSCPFFLFKITLNDKQNTSDIALQIANCRICPRKKYAHLNLEHLYTCLLKLGLTSHETQAHARKKNRKEIHRGIQAGESRGC